jgi:hypothetical protein
VSRVSDPLDLAAILITVGLLALTYAGESGPLRILLALGFAFFVPGRAIVTNWPRTASWSEVAMSMVLSLACLTLLATTTLWAHAWEPMALFQIVAWPSLVGLFFGIWRRHAHRRGHPTQPPEPPDQPDQQPGLTNYPTKPLELWKGM